MTPVAHEWADPKLPNADACPDKATRHTPMPSSYTGMALNADDRMAAGQQQTRCPTCGFLAIWFGGRAVKGWPRRPPVPR